MVAAADYQNPITKNRLKEKIRYLGRSKMYFGDYQKLLGNSR
jgi:hypothetical protein